MAGYHEPVLLREVIDALGVKAGEWFLDCTLGDGGHSLEILKLGGKVVGIDVDPQALERARKRLQGAGYSGQDFVLLKGNFREVKNLLDKPVSPKGGRGEQADLADQKFKGVIFDLGVSSLQLMNPKRGFSFTKEGPLDMRMDPSLQVRALDLINGLNKGELNELFFKLGEEIHSRALAEALVSAREVRTDSRFGVENYTSRSSNLAFRLRRNVGGIKTTRDLAEIVERVVGGKHGKIHPATQVFQALRIAVNDELNSLKEALPKSLEVLKKDGTLIIISFHSLEDRIVKRTFKTWADLGLGQVLTRKPIVPSEAEVQENPRSRSAKLRIFKKHDNNSKF